MPSHLLHRMISGAAALTLLASSAVVAQSDVDLPTDTRFPEEFGPTLTTSLVTSALDDESVNTQIARSVRDYHAKLGGRNKEPVDPAEAKKKKSESRGGLLVVDPQDGGERVTEQVLDIVGQYRPELIIVSGGEGQTNASIARSATDSIIVDLSQPRPCLTQTGQPDPTGECAGSGSAIPFTYAAVEFAVEDAAFLAGVVAARLSKNSLGVISGYEGCLECQRYVEGFINGARSVEPEIEIETAYLADSEVAGFGDSASAKTFTEAFIDIYRPDVILPVGRAATPGMVEAACEAGVWAVGTGWDVSATRPTLDECVMASVTKDVARGVTDAMYLFSAGQNRPVTTYDLGSGAVALTDEWRNIPTLPVDTDEFYQEAERAILAGEIEACPDGCGGSLDLSEGLVEADVE